MDNQPPQRQLASAGPRRRQDAEGSGSASSIGSFGPCPPACLDGRCASGHARGTRTDGAGSTSGDEIGFALVHGSEFGAWLCERLVRLLRRPAVPVDLPCRGEQPVASRRAVSLRDAVMAVAEDAGRCDADRVVIVAHSFSGILVPPAVAQLGDGVPAVVFLARPWRWKAFIDLLPAAQRLMLRVMYRLLLEPVSPATLPSGLPSTTSV